MIVFFDLKWGCEKAKVDQGSKQSANFIRSNL